MADALAAKLSLRDPTPSEPVASTSAAAAAASAIILPPDHRQLTLSETVDLHLFDASSQFFMIQERGVAANLWIVSGREFPCWLTVTSAKPDGDVWVSTAVDPSMPLTFAEVRLDSPPGTSTII